MTLITESVNTEDSATHLIKHRSNFVCWYTVKISSVPWAILSVSWAGECWPVSCAESWSALNNLYENQRTTLMKLPLTQQLSWKQTKKNK